MLSRRVLNLISCVVGLWLFLCGTITLGAPRNVILFVVDDQGKDAGCYGNPIIQTPHLDDLAADGTLFTHAFCTTASCSASRSVILTGRHKPRQRPVRASALVSQFPTPSRACVLCRCG